MLKPRTRKFLDNLPKNNFNVSKSAVDAGYSRKYADKRGKYLLNVAMKAHAKEIVEALEDGPVTKEEAKRLMSELVGLSREDVFGLLVKIANQDRDYGSALKVLAPLAKEHGVVLQEETQKTIVPVLNIGIRERETPLVLTDEEPIPQDSPIEP